MITFQILETEKSSKTAKQFFYYDNDTLKEFKDGKLQVTATSKAITSGQLKTKNTNYNLALIAVTKQFAAYHFKEVDKTKQFNQNNKKADTQTKVNDKIKALLKDIIKETNVTANDINNLPFYTTTLKEDIVNG